MQKSGNVKPSASFLQSFHGIMFLEEAWSWLQVWTLCVCVHITMRIGMHDLFCERPFETRLFPWAKTIINSGGRGMTKKIKAAVEGIKLTTGFWRYRPKRLLFELASSKSRTLGVDQNFLIFWRPRELSKSICNVYLPSSQTTKLPSASKGSTPFKKQLIHG